MVADEPTEPAEEQPAVHRPDDVRVVTEDGDPPGLADLFGGTTAKVIDGFIEAGPGRRFTAVEIGEEFPGVSRPSFTRNKETLIDFGIIVEDGTKKGGATAYRLNDDPKPAALAMFLQLCRNGRTEQLLTESVVHDPIVEFASDILRHRGTPLTAVEIADTMAAPDPDPETVVEKLSADPRFSQDPTTGRWELSE